MQRRFFAVILTMLCGVSLCAQAQTPPAATPDLRLEAFVSGVWEPGQLYVTLRQPDGRMLIGGRFGRADGGIPRSALLRLNRDGSIDTGFAPLLAGLSTVNVYALAVHGGAIYVGGFFETVNGVTMRSIVRLRMDGSSEPGWSSPFSSAAANQVQSIAVTVNGVYVGGDINEQDRYGLARLATATGALDPAWIAQTQFGVTGTPNGGNRGEVTAMIADGGDLIVAGQFSQIAGVARTGIARISQSAPVSVRAFDAQVSGRVDALQASGTQLYIGGTFFRSNPAINYLNRIDAVSGAVDAGWAPNTTGSVDALRLIGDRLYVGGSFTNQPPGGARLLRIATNGNGAIDATFNPGANDTVLTLADTCRGNLLAGGTFTQMSGLFRNAFAAFPVPQIDCIFHGDFEVQ